MPPARGRRAPAGSSFTLARAARRTSTCAPHGGSVSESLSTRTPSRARDGPRRRARERGLATRRRHVPAPALRHQRLHRAAPAQALDVLAHPALDARDRADERCHGRRSGRVLRLEPARAHHADERRPLRPRRPARARRREAFALHERYINPQMPRVLRTIGFDADYVRAEGAYLFDRDGRRYLDFLAGFGVFAARPLPSRDRAGAARRDGRSSCRTSCRWSARRCRGCSPRRSSPACPTTRIAASSRTAARSRSRRCIKYARCATGRSRILFADHAFHGLTTGALSLNGGREFRDRFGDLLPGCQSVAVRRSRRVAARARGRRRRRVRRRADPGQGRVRRARRIPARGRPSCATGTARCSPSTRSRPGSAAPARSSPSSSGTSCPTRHASPRRCRAATSPSARSSPRATSSRRVFDKIDRAVVHSSTFGQNVLAMTAGLATLHTLDAESIVENASTIGAAPDVRASRTSRNGTSSCTRSGAAA